MTKTILAVDDSFSIRRLLSSLLTPFGYQVIEAENGEDGLGKLIENKVDLIITDLHMPKLDGIGLISGVRNGYHDRFLPIVMLTTEDQVQMRQAGLSAGATAWLTKPFKHEELLAVIRKFLW